MAANPSPDSDADSVRSALPFEPKRRKAVPKPDKPSSPRPNAPRSAPKKSAGKASSVSGKRSPQSASVSSSAVRSGIPDDVSKRMIRRMALFCGVPTALGISSFFISYLAVTQGFQLPNTVVLLVSLGLFGLGVIGLTYGVLSSSWEEGVPGSLLGFSEFRLNLGRTLSAWRASKDSEK